MAYSKNIKVIQIGPRPTENPPEIMPMINYSTPERPVFLKDWEYSQSLSWEVTDDPLKAIDLNSSKCNHDFDIQLFVTERGGKVCEYGVTVWKL